MSSLFHHLWCCWLLRVMPTNKTQKDMNRTCKNNSSDSEQKQQSNKKKMKNDTNPTLLIVGH